MAGSEIESGDGRYPSADDLLAQAAANTGLSDFGPGDFREGLEALLKSVADDAEFDPSVDDAVIAMFRRRLENRLSLEQWLSAHPETLDAPVLGPVDIIGLPRTGTTALANKRVLVVSSHYHSIRKQWPNMDRVWGQHRDTIAPFKLVDVIRSPYTPSIDDRQYQPTWHDTVEHLRGLMSEVDYDVALIGAGSMAPALAQHAKLCGKVGITLCGTTQLFFGLMGSRWAKQPEHTDCRKYFNGAWCYPDPIDRPQRVEVMDRLELAYW